MTTQPCLSEGPGHSHDIVSCTESHGGTGATILPFRREEPYSQGWYGRLGDLEKEIVLIIAKKDLALEIEDSLQIMKKSGDQAMALSKLRVTRFCRLTELG